MFFYVYMLKTTDKANVRTYVGYTNNLKLRLSKHRNNKGAKATKGYKWVIIYKKKYFTKSKAMREEYQLKKDRKYRNKIKNNYLLSLHD